MNDLNYFMSGQVWQYNTRSGEEASTITILKIDDLEEDVIIHIRIDGLHSPWGNYIEHLAFSVDALEASNISFVKHLDRVPEFEAGYEQWKKAFDSGKQDIRRSK